MGGIYQLTFFLAVTLLAIVITIFVFAVSLLGRAVEVASREQEKTTREQKDATEREIAEMQKQISALMKKKRIGQELRELEKRLKQLRKQDKNFEKKLSRIGSMPELLRVKGAVIHPGISLGIALTLTGVAWYLSSIGIPTVPAIIWGLGLAAIGYSIYRIYRSLKVVESVAITSEEAALKRTVEAYKIAQKELEEEKKPELQLTFRGKEFPLHVKADSEVSLPLELRMRKGNFAEDVSVHIIASPGFDFLGLKSYTLDSDHDYPNYIGIKWEVGKVVKGLVVRNTITIKSPLTAGSFDIVYYIFCRGCRAEPVEREIIVE